MQQTKQKKQKVRPVSKKKKSEMKAARESLASGELAAEDQVRRAQRDLCSLYIRFKDKKDLPENIEELKKLHEDIQIVRVPRQAKKKLSFAFFEFSSEAKCEEAKIALGTNKSIYVDYVGTKSKNGGKQKEQRGGKGKNKQQINPTRLFITGLFEGMTEEKLKQLFPKCNNANIPKGSVRKGTVYGFVQFNNPSDAKSAFDAAKKLTIQTNEDKEKKSTDKVAEKKSKKSKSKKKKTDSNDKSQNKPKDTEESECEKKELDTEMEVSDENKTGNGKENEKIEEDSGDECDIDENSGDENEADSEDDKEAESDDEDEES